MNFVYVVSDAVETCDGQQVNVELILDASGSMAERVDGQPKLDTARSVLSKFLATLPSNANVALRVYGHKGSNDPADKELSCGARTKLLWFSR